MSSRSISTSPPASSNPRGMVVVEGSTTSLAFVLIVVCLRIWGRYRYNSSPGTSVSQFGEPRFWVVLSDLAIVLSFVVALVLTVIACISAEWGLGYHTKELSITQANMTLEMFFLYQILYKFGAGISKIATCLLLLAISVPQMKWFNRTCKALILYISGYCISCSIATVFQCGTHVRSNWVHTDDQSHCFSKPPFWYTHAGLNIFASILIAALPWWLFYNITYKRKVTIGVIMSALSIAEVILGCVRLKGLYQSAHSLSDLSYGATTGILVSQLEVNFGIISACIPTVLKMIEDAIKRVFGFSFGGTSHEAAAYSHSQSRTLAPSASDVPGKDKSKCRSQYGRFGDDDLEMDSMHSGNSRENIIRDDKMLDQHIKIEKTYIVEREDDPDSPNAHQVNFPTNVKSSKEM